MPQWGAETETQLLIWPGPSARQHLLSCLSVRASCPRCLMLSLHPTGRNIWEDSTDVVLSLLLFVIQMRKKSKIAGDTVLISRQNNNIFCSRPADLKLICK